MVAKLVVPMKRQEIKRRCQDDEVNERHRRRVGCWMVQ